MGFLEVEIPFHRPLYVSIFFLYDPIKARHRVDRMQLRSAESSPWTATKAPIGNMSSIDRKTQIARIRRRVYFLLLICILVAQSAFIVHVTEPYPAIWSPGFQGGIQKQSYQKPTIRFRFADNTEAETSRSKLLEQFPQSHQGTMMEFFKPLPLKKVTKQSRITTFFPGYYTGHINRRNNSDRVWAWFQKQAERLFARTDLVLVRVEWNKYGIPNHEYQEEFGVYELPQGN